MKNILTLGLMMLSTAFAQGQSYTLSGTVVDNESGETAVNALIEDLNGSGKAISNVYGFFSLDLSPGRHNVRISSMGYRDDTLALDIQSNQSVTVRLKTMAQELGNIVVTGEKQNANITSTEMSTVQLTSKEIQRIPQLLGETDILRTITLMPGVTTVGEGASGFNVRGGNSDQNLIILDEAPVFNSSHLFGLFGVFNADAVKDMKLYKGGIPAIYGGRLSSVLDVRQKEGNQRQFSGNGGLGLLSSRLMLEGPIIKDKMSYMVAGRRSYIDVFFPLFNNEDLQSTVFYFYDLNAKVNYTFNRKSRLYASAYWGRDVFGIADLFNFGWGNLTGTLRWNYILNDKLFMNLTGVYSDYTYNVGTPEDSDLNFSLDSRIRNYIFNANFTWYASNRHEIDYGVNTTTYHFYPGIIRGSIETELQKEYATEAALFISDEWKINENLTAEIGLRYSGLVNFGPRDVQQYRNGATVLHDSTVTGIRQYASGEIIASHFDAGGLEPRVALTYTLSESQSIKVGYNRTRQYIHLISNTTTPTPVDIWRPAGKYIDPATANQIVLGYFRNFADNAYKFSAETYYKSFSNLIDYKDGADLIFNDHVETELLTGKGRAYGLELMIEKKAGRFTGWLSYTLSRSERLVRGAYRSTTINRGEWYPANFDKPHIITLVVNATLGDSWDLGMNFTYQTGRPITYPDGTAVYEGISYPVYTNRNGARIPDYHRLDISATRTFKKSGRWEHRLTFGVYNAYGRRNAYSIFFRQNEDRPEMNEAVKLSIFGTIAPFVTYNFNF